MYTIGQLAKAYGLSRSTLLYYDSIGIFSPSGRSNSNYRVYTKADRDRLEQICIFRKTGLGLNDIGRIMHTRGKRGVLPLLEKRLDALNGEIRALRNQQHFIVQLLKNDRALSLVSDEGSQSCTLEGVINPSAIVRIFSGIDQPGFSCGYEKPIWDDREPDPAVLYDPDGNEVDRYP